MGIQTGEDINLQFDDEDKKKFTCPAQFVPEAGGMGYEFFMAMRKNKQKVAQYLVDLDEEDTYESLLQRSVRVALKLKSKGYDRDREDIICLCSHNQKNSAVPFLSATFLGIKVCSLDPTLSQSDVTHLIDQVKPSLFFVTQRSSDLIKNALEELGLKSEVVVYEDESFEEFLEEGEEEETFEPVIVEDLFETAVIFFSSGTTGFPKGICLNHYGLLSQSMGLVLAGNMTSVTLSYASLYWISVVLIFTATVKCGFARVICSTYTPNDFYKLVDKYKITLAILAPNQGIDVARSPRADNLDTSSLNMVIIGGGCLSETYIKELWELLPGTFVCHAYGQTEVAGILCLFRSNNVNDTLGLYHKPNSCGRPIPGMSYKVVELETDTLCGPFQRGELCVKSNNIMNGYHNADSSETFDSDGWLKTGDIVYYDDEFFFYVVDRIKEMLKFRSWHVAPAVLERVILQHPAVNKAVVIGIPDEEDGDHPMALVLLNEDVDGVTEDELRSYVDERVDDKQKLRGGLKIIHDIPLTPSGKVKRKYLQKLVLEGKI